MNCANSFANNGASVGFRVLWEQRAANHRILLIPCVVQGVPGLHYRGKGMSRRTLSRSQTRHCSGAVRLLLRVGCLLRPHATFTARQEEVCTQEKTTTHSLVIEGSQFCAEAAYIIVYRALKNALLRVCSCMWEWNTGVSLRVSAVVVQEQCLSFSPSV